MRMAPRLKSSRSKEFEMIRGTNSGFKKDRLPKSTAFAALAACALLAAGAFEFCLAAPSSPTNFASPHDASRALAPAVQRPDERAGRQILREEREIVSSD